jgi:hypothetical protein
MPKDKVIELVKDVIDFIGLSSSYRRIKAFLS